MNLQLRGKAKPDKASDHPCLLLCTWVGLPASSRQSRHFFGRGSLPSDSNLWPVDIKMNHKIFPKIFLPFLKWPFSSFPVSLVIPSEWLKSKDSISSNEKENVVFVFLGLGYTNHCVYQIRPFTEIFMIYSPSQMNRLLTVCMFPVFIAHSSVDGHLDCFCSLDMGSRVGMNMNKQISLGKI